MSGTWRGLELLERLKEYEGPIRGAEIGVAEGETSATLLMHREDLHLIMVDSWEPEEQQPEHYRDTPDVRAHMTEGEQERAKRLATESTRCAGDRRTILHMPSTQAAKEVEDGSLDFVWIDGAHSYQAVRDDIRAWAPKVRTGGLVSGHDYPGHRGVRMAVNEWIYQNRMGLRTGDARMWYVRKP